VKKNSPEMVRFEYTYKQMDKELLSNLTGPRKVMQIQIAFMTSYDERVFKNVEKHEFAIRGALLDAMRQYTEADVNRPEFRKELAERLKEEANKVLTQYEDFGGIDAVHFTSFIVQ
jgi:flagellar FliL protein